MRVLLLLLIVVPALEIGVLILSGNVIGIWPTVGLIILTGVIGAALARQQGAEVIRLAQVQMRNGDVPSEAILDGICVLAGGVLLLTPGFITDAAGFLLLSPLTRGSLKLGMKKWFRKMIGRGRISFFTWR